MYESEFFKSPIETGERMMLETSRVEVEKYQIWGLFEVEESTAAPG